MRRGRRVAAAIREGLGLFVFAIGMLTMGAVVAREGMAQPQKDDACWKPLGGGPCACADGTKEECLFDKDCQALYEEECPQS